MNKNRTMIPFSNGTEAINWYASNCELCVKAYFPKDDNYPNDKTMRKYCSIGKECKLKYTIDLAFITGEISTDIANQIGLNEHGQINESCMMFSDNNDDGYKSPKIPKPDNTPDNQILLFSEFDELLNRKIEVYETINN